MRKTSAYLILGAMMLASGAADAKSYKRGVGENQFMLTKQLQALEPGVSWWYNWGNTPTGGLNNEILQYEGMDYIPMCWNANYSADNIRAYVKNHPNCKYLLGFNEPNFLKQSNMTPEQAAENWTAVKALADELGLKLVSPALNYSPDAPYQDPVKWMDEFVAIVGTDAFDYTAVHNYGGLGVMKDLCTRFYERYGKPVWVTEFCLWPGGAGNVYVAPDAQLASCIESVQWLEQTDFIYRYAWFKPIGAFDSKNQPNYGLLDTEINKLPDGTREYNVSLTNLGAVYTYMTDFDPEVWHGVGEAFSATNYIDQSMVLLGKTSLKDAPLPIEVTKFNSGAWLDYQFDVPAEGTYGLVLTVGGYGQPSRFDPGIQIFLNKDGELEQLTEPVSFALPNSDTAYAQKTFTLRLKAGKQTIRVADANPYQPSGLTIATLGLYDGTGVGEILGEGAENGEENGGDAAIYTIDGRRVSGVPTEPGLYIRNGRKYIVR